MKRTHLFTVAVALALGTFWVGPSGSAVGPMGQIDPYSVWPESFAQSGVNPFVGKWVNADPATSSFTKMAISIEWGQMKVEVWARCSPEDCYWPSVVAHIPRCETQRIEATWVLPIVNEFMDITLTEDDRLLIRGKSFYTYDASGRCGQYTLEFIRGDFPLAK